ncbi:MAG: ETC complex I subunit [Pseudomonadota bacterium]
MRARIYKPAKTAMSSGMAKTRDWVLEFVPEIPREIDPLTGWTGSRDMQAQVQLQFETQKEAEDYAKDRGIEYVMLRPQGRKANLRPGGYGENFATDRRGSWTH